MSTVILKHKKEKPITHLSSEINIEHSFEMSSKLTYLNHKYGDESVATIGKQKRDEILASTKDSPHPI